LEIDSKLSNDEKHKKAVSLRDKIKKMRQSGLEKGGEFSVENLSFKYLRNNNYLEKLHTIIKKMRQSGLEKGGEFSVENLSFKYLRNNNYLEKLHTIIQKSLDKKLSLK
jgi:hypothetical protein